MDVERVAGLALRDRRRFDRRAIIDDGRMRSAQFREHARSALLNLDEAGVIDDGTPGGGFDV